MTLSGNLPNNSNVWQTTEPMKLEIKGRGRLHHWSQIIEFFQLRWPLSLCRHLCFLSIFKLSTSSFTHHPRVTKVRTALHVHVRTLTQLATRGFWVNLHLVIVQKLTLVEGLQAVFVFPLVTIAHFEISHKDSLKFTLVVKWVSLHMSFYWLALTQLSWSWQLWCHAHVCDNWNELHRNYSALHWKKNTQLKQPEEW